MSDLRIATRASRLAIAQANLVAERLRSVHDGIEVELVEITTTGDHDRVTSLTELSEVGAFVRAVQSAVLDGRADLAVHSAKDLPVSGPERLTAVYPPRESPWDVMCGGSLVDLPHRARVGTGSPRRRAQLGLLRPDLVVEPIRGNVDTRIAKTRDGSYQAVVLAHAGLIRLGRGDEADQVFDLAEMVPAPAQAALAVETIAGGRVESLLQPLADPTTTLEVTAERALLAFTNAGCRAALGALARVDGDALTMTGFVADEAGPRRAQAQGPDPVAVASRLQEALGL